MKIYETLEELTGNTPLFELKNIEKKYDLKSKILAKLEFFNPAGSIKDRAAQAMLNDAIKSGKINDETVIIEPTSGNTGIGLASFTASKGLKAILVMPDNMSEERRKLLKAYGAELVLTDGNLGMKGAIEKAYELHKEIKNSYIPEQFENPSNPNAHYNSTGPEIWRDTDGKIDIFISAFGTGGTVSGVGKFLKSKNSEIKVIGVEPKSSPFVSEGKAGRHKIQGIGAGFIPKTLDVKILDEVITVSDENALQTGREFAKTEGFLIGISSGAALFAAIQTAKKEENKEKTIVVIFPDNGERYLSSEMYL